jgi:sporulation protein YlmC with PRC-barrel domain
MRTNLAYAALAAAAVAGSAALAQQAGDTGQPPAAQSGGQFIEKQTVSEWRAPKLIGIDVYGSDNQKVGKIKDVLMSHDGKADAVVIGVGGFLGIGSKDVAVPFQAVQWRTEGRVVPSELPPPSTAPLTTAGGQQPAPPPPPKMTDPAATEASQGYPDKAMIDMTEAQLKSAPGFQYAPNPLAEATESGSQSAATQRPQPQPSKP